MVVGEAELDVSDAVHVLRRVFGYDTFRGQPAGDHRPRHRRRRRARADADRRRQVAVLPDPGAGAPRRRRRRLAAHRADAGPGRRADGARACGPGSSTPRRTPASAARVEAAFLAGELDLLYLAPERLRVRVDAAACSSAARSRCSPSTRRTACRSGDTTSGPTTSRCRRCTSGGPTCRGSR